MDLNSDARIGPHEIVRRLGRGATGMVCVAAHPRHGEVAFAAIHPDIAAERDPRSPGVRIIVVQGVG